MRVILIILALMLLACTLSSVPPTQTPAPFPTIDPALQFSAPLTPNAAQSFGAVTLTPTLEITGAGMGDGTTGAVMGANPNCPQPVGWIAYVVEAGDTLGLLSAQTDTPVADLAAGNCISDADTLYLGQTIYLPRQPVVSP
jgi:hypothetical protein